MQAWGRLTPFQKTAWLAALLLLSVSAGFHFWLGNIGDKDWLLIAARMWVGGKRLYADIFESNPPLIIWIYSIPAWLYLHIGLIEDYQWLVLLALLAIIASSYLILRLLRLNPELKEPERLALVLLLGFVFIFWTNPGYFFDREHIFFILTLPYVLRFMPSLNRARVPQRLGIVIGLLAGVGFCIKPYCFVVFAAVQLLYFLRERDVKILWSIENFLIYGIGVLYLLVTALFAPEYFTLVVPMALATYSGYALPGNGLFFFLFALLSFGITFADFRLRHKTPYRGDILYMVYLCLGYLGYALLNNGWGYTWHPLMSQILFVTGWVFLEHRWLKRKRAAQGKRVKTFVFGMRACGINFAINTAAVLVTYFFALTAQCGNFSECMLDKQMVQALESRQAKSFGVIGIIFEPWPYLVRTTGATIETRFNHLWMLPKLFTGGEPEARAHQWITDYVSESLAEDLNTHAPAVVFVDTSPEFFVTHLHVDLIAYLSRNADFAEAWKHYRLLETLSICHAPPENARKGIAKDFRSTCRYGVFVRREEQ